MPGRDASPTVAPHTDIRYIEIMRELQVVVTALNALTGKYTLAGTGTHYFPTDPSTAYTGIDNSHAALVYAQLADLNTLRAVVSTLVGVVRQLVTDVGSV